MKLITVEEAKERFNIGEYEPLGDLDYDAVLLFEGDTIIDADIKDNSIEEVFFNGERSTEEELIIVNGNLTVNGSIELFAETGYPALLILGDVHCEQLHSNDGLTHIKGDAHIKYAFSGTYNHGTIVIEGTTNVPYVFNSDHMSDINPSDTAILVNTYNNSSEDIERVFVEEVCNGDEIEMEAFVAHLAAGKNPLKEGAKMSRELVVEEIEGLAVEYKAGKEIKELDLSNKKLHQLPAALFEITSLEILTIEENGKLTDIPVEIGQLSNLKVLNLKKTRIKQLPATIGKLKHLEQLNLCYCHSLESLPIEIGNLENLKKLQLWSFKGEVPASISKLSSLEELEILGVNKLNDKEEIIGFPDWVFELKGLKKLRFNPKHIATKDMEGLKKLNPNIVVKH